MIKKYLMRFAAAFVVAGLAACGGGGGGDTCIGCPDTSDSDATAEPQSLAIQLSTSSVSTDNSDAAEIAVTVLDRDNAPIAERTVTFSAERGQLSAATALTDESGVATVSFRGGTQETVNRTGTVVVRSGGLSKTVSILVAGSTLTAVPPSTSQVVIGESVTLRFVVRDAGGTAVQGQTLRIGTSGSGTVALNGSQSEIEASTGTDGGVSTTVTGVSSGDVTVTANWLDSDDVVSSSNSIVLSVQGSGDALKIETDDPDTAVIENWSPSAARINQAISVGVNVPGQISGVNVTQVRFATTSGTWASNGSSTFTRSVSIDPSGNARMAEVLNMSGTAGVASVSVQALSAGGSVLATVNHTVSVTAPPGSAAKITLQASSTTLPISTTDTPSTAILTATVRDAANNVVGDADVVFKVLNDTGTGASISPVVARTNSSTTSGALGQAESTFTAGQLPTNQAFSISAEVTDGSGTVYSATLPMAVGGVAASVTLGQATIIDSINSATAYSLPMSVQVTDASGAQLEGARVSMSVWPVGYARGVRDPDDDCRAVYLAATIDPLPGFTVFEKNEDDNENLVLDPGEDQDGPGMVPDGKLTPAASTAGAVPATVTTDENGLATFDYVYLKNYADWLRVRVRATVEVQGTEKQTELNFTLRHSVEDEDPCVLPQSPFN